MLSLTDDTEAQYAALTFVANERYTERIQQNAEWSTAASRKTICSANQ
jgi:hypothetical protein